MTKLESIILIVPFVLISCESVENKSQTEKAEQITQEIQLSDIEEPKIKLSNNSEIMGTWNGLIGREKLYLIIESSNKEISGKSCEFEDDECINLQDVKYLNNQLKFKYVIGEKTIIAQLNYKNDVLEGSYTIANSNDSIPAKFTRKK